MKQPHCFRLQEMIDNNKLGETETEFNQRHTVVKMKQLEIRSIKLLSAPDSLPDAEDYLRSNKANILEAANEMVKAEMDYDGNNIALQFEEMKKEILIQAATVMQKQNILYACIKQLCYCNC